YLFSPLVIKKVTGLSPLIIILAVLVGVELGGFWGLLLSIPGALLFMEIMNDVEKHKISVREKNLSR
ncbi:MAG: AI-2E family transporter, partial [bacterium]